MQILHCTICRKHNSYISGLKQLLLRRHRWPDFAFLQFLLFDEQVGKCYRVSSFSHFSSLSFPNLCSPPCRFYCSSIASNLNYTTWILGLILELGLYAGFALTLIFKIQVEKYFLNNTQKSTNWERKIKLIW